MTPLLEWIFGKHVHNLAQTLHLAIEHAKVHKDCDCTIPETTCPPRCSDTIAWSIQRGALPQASIVVRNTGEAERTFDFTTTALSGIGTGSAHLQATPEQATLAPGERAVVQVSLIGSKTLTACQEYRAEFGYRGSWDQCIRIHIKVGADPSDAASIVVGQTPQHAEHGKRPDAPVASLDWTMQRGVQPTATLCLHNRGQSTQSFTFEPSPWVGPGGEAAGLHIEPKEVSIAAGEQATVQLSLLGSVKLHPGQHYHADLTLRGSCDQRVRLHAYVQADPAAHSEVEQGELPTRVRAHHWYHHFQCTELCAKPPRTDKSPAA